MLFTDTILQTYNWTPRVKNNKKTKQKTNKKTAAKRKLESISNEASYWKQQLWGILLQVIHIYIFKVMNKTELLILS